MKVALVYDRVNKWGGAERVLLSLHKLFPDAPLFTSVYHPQSASWAKVFDVRTSFLQKIPFASVHHELLPTLMPAAFESFSFDEYDLVISVTSEAAKGIITKPHTKHITYLLTPTRYLWSGYDEYFKNKALKTLATPAVKALRAWDTIAAHRSDVLVSISQEVKRRARKYYGRDSLVIYPALTLEGKGASIRQPQDKRGKGKKGEYFLIVSRFVPYKRIDIAIEACNRLKLPLKIVGSGAEEKRLKALAGPTVEFVGNLTDEELIDYYRNSKALLFPGIEDFGLAVLEAQNLGRPVIALRKGGAVETIKEGSTGYFFDEQTPESLVKALKKFDRFIFDEKQFAKHLEKFSFQRFKKKFYRSCRQSFLIL